MFGFSYISKFFVLIICLVCFSSISRAENSATHFTIDVSALDQIVNDDRLNLDQKCQNAWDFIWGHIEDGNPAISGILLTYMPLAMGLHDLPRPSADRLTRERDQLILAAHAADYMDPPNYREDDFLYSFLQGLFYHEDYKNCIQNQNPHCSRILVENKQIPSFEEYAKELTLFHEAGYRPECTGGWHYHRED